MQEKQDSKVLVEMMCAGALRSGGLLLEFSASPLLSAPAFPLWGVDSASSMETKHMRVSILVSTRQINWTQVTPWGCLEAVTQGCVVHGWGGVARGRVAQPSDILCKFPG